MQVYPAPEKPYGAPLIVPYLLSRLEHTSSNFTYDDEGFLHFPARKGFDKTLFSKKEGPDFLQGRSAFEAAAFLQEWLFFGFLSEILNVRILKGRFLSDITGQLTISIDALGSHITAWQNQIRKLNDNERDIEGQRVDKTFQEFTELVNYCLTDTGSATPICPLSQYPEIPNSIILMAEILTYLKRLVFPKSRHFKLGMSALISTNMRGLREHGSWCLTDVSMVNAQFSANAAYFAMRLGPSPSRRNHSTCTADECRWHNLSDYEPRHSMDCNCSDRSKEAYTTFPVEGIRPLLGDGVFPLVTIHSIGESCEVRMQSAKNSKTSFRCFVAISHVFADGLGNEHENALPACQLKRLQRLVDALYNDKPGCLESPLPFWFDTFCIPQGLSDKQVKKDAIADMTTVYSSADRVLVLDADLLLFDAQPAIQHSNYNEIFMRIKLSRWMRRLWTLQEAILSSDLWFQFKDGPLRFRDLRNTFKSLIDSGGWSPIDVVYPTTLSALDRIVQFPRPKGNESPSECDWIKRRQINSVHNLLHYRSTKRREDEAILLGSIMLLSKQDKLKIQRPEGHLRLQKFISILGCSREIIFSRGERMPENGWRWAPMTFMPTDLKSQLQINEQAKIEEMDSTGEGLLVKGSRFEIQFQSDDREFPHPLMLAASGLTKYVVNNLPGPPPPVSSWHALRLHEVKKLGLLLNNPIAKGSGQMELAILVDLQACGIGTINTVNDILVTKVKARYVGRVTVQRYDMDAPTLSFWQASEVPDDEWWVLC